MCILFFFMCVGGGPSNRIIVFGGLYWGSRIQGNSHMKSTIMENEMEKDNGK